MFFGIRIQVSLSQTLFLFLNNSFFASAHTNIIHRPSTPKQQPPLTKSKHSTPQTSNSKKRKRVAIDFFSPLSVTLSQLHGRISIATVVKYVYVHLTCIYRTVVNTATPDRLPLPVSYHVLFVCHPILHLFALDRILNLILHHNYVWYSM